MFIRLTSNWQLVNLESSGSGGPTQLIVGSTMRSESESYCESISIIIELVLSTSTRVDNGFNLEESRRQATLSLNSIPKSKLMRFNSITTESPQPPQPHRAATPLPHHHTTATQHQSISLPFAHMDCEHEYRKL